MATKVSIGTVSHGTMRPEDLIPDFLWELEHLNKDAAEKIETDYPEYTDAEEDSDFWDEDATYMLEALFDALNEQAPAFCYFGATEGDGSDYGFWPNLEAAEEESLKVSDLSEIPPRYCGHVLHVNDHGNITLYWKASTSPRVPLKEIWAIV